jgi:hypothetical protein
LALDRVEVVLKTIATEVLEIGFEDGGPEDGRSVFWCMGGRMLLVGGVR